MRRTASSHRSPAFGLPGTSDRSAGHEADSSSAKLSCSAINRHSSARSSPSTVRNAPAPPPWRRRAARGWPTAARRRFAGSRQPGTPIPSVALPSVAPDAELYERITKAIEQPQRVDSVTIDWLERCLAEHRRVEDTLGSRPLLPIVRAQLDTASSLAQAASGPLADRVVAMLGQYAQFLAWMCQDSGDHAAALAWNDRSHGWALEAGDAALAATTLNMRAHMAWSIGDALRCVRLAEPSRRPTPPSLRPDQARSPPTIQSAIPGSCSNWMASGAYACHNDLRVRLS